MTRYLLIFIMILSLNIASGQNREKYNQYVEEAWKLYEDQNYTQSAIKYKEAFDQLDGKATFTDRYNAACAYALSGDKENAFFHLNYLADNPKIKYNSYDHLINDKDLVSLHKDERWPSLVNTVKKNKDEYEKYFDHELIAQLDSIHNLDQNYRIQIEEIEKKYGRKSPEMQAHWKLIKETDSVNLIKVRRILDTRGWLGPKIVGAQGNVTLFLVIQHADIDTQIKYLPMMREAVKNGDAEASSLAMLEDRVALRQGKKQIYGSQIMMDQKTGEHYVSPIEDPDNVNKRRSEVGLGTIEDYVANWNIIWDVEKHKERTKTLELKSNK